MSFNGITEAKGGYEFKSAAISLIPLSLYLTEVVTTTLRRLLSRKSPFIGDQFHLHHLLHHYKKIGVNSTTTIIGCAHLAVSTLALALCFYAFDISIMIGLATWITMTMFYFSLGKRVWFQGQRPSVLLGDFFGSLKKEKILLIDSSVSDKFEIRVIDSRSSEQEDENVA